VVVANRRHPAAVAVARAVAAVAGAAVADVPIPAATVVRGTRRTGVAAADGRGIAAVIVAHALRAVVTDTVWSVRAAAIGVTQTIAGVAGTAVANIAAAALAV
jgi:hypothetical protein